MTRYETALAVVATLFAVGLLADFVWRVRGVIAAAKASSAPPPRVNVSFRGIA